MEGTQAALATGIEQRPLILTEYMTLLHDTACSFIAPAYTYEFRYWGLRELQDLLKDAGFREVVVFWPDADEETGELTGEFSRAEQGTDDETFTCYLACAA